MENIEKMSPEVLIYIQTIKKYMNDNVATRKYFAIDYNEEYFFENLSELSQKNFEENGEPQLSLEQFENLRKKMHGTDDDQKASIGLFISVGNFGYASLN
jgi:hypothetical protein